MSFLSSTFVLAAPDLALTVAYFRDALGFQVAAPRESGWQLVTRDGVRIMIGHCPDTIPPSVIGDHSYFAYLLVVNADMLYNELASRGAIILKPPADQPHGMRELVVGTPDGHRLVMGQKIIA